MPPDAEQMAVNFAINVMASPPFEFRFTPDWKQVFWTHRNFTVSAILVEGTWKYFTEDNGVRSPLQDFKHGRYIWTIQGIIDNYRNVRLF